MQYYAVLGGSLLMELSFRSLSQEPPNAVPGQRERQLRVQYMHMRGSQRRTSFRHCRSELSVNLCSLILNAEAFLACLKRLSCHTHQLFKLLSFVVGR